MNKPTFPLAIKVFLLILVILFFLVVGGIFYFVKNPIKSASIQLTTNQSADTNISNSGKENTVFTNYSTLPFTEIYNTPGAGFSVNYPANKDWVWRVDIHDTENSHAIIFADEDASSLQGPTKFTRIAINSDDEFGPNWKKSLETETGLILDDYKNKTLTTRNIKALLPELPNNTVAEVFEVQGFVSMQGGLLKEEKGLFMVASNGTKKYRFDFRADPQDFDTLYPLVVKVLKTFSIRQ